MLGSVRPSYEARLEPVAVAPLGAVLAAIAAVHGAALAGYGYFRDELYYLASRAHLGFGYVDQPPLSILLLSGWTRLFGDSVIAIRLLALLATLVAATLCALLARELGGGGFAQGLAALCFGFAPVLMGAGHVYSMNVLDAVFWLLSAWLLARLLRTGDTRRWPLLGLVLGLGLENKISVLWLGAGIAVGLLLTPERSHLRRGGPWLAAAIALALFLPYVLWNATHGFPTLEFIHNAEARKMVATSPLELLEGLALEMNPAIAPVWIGGLLWTLFGHEGRRWRIFAFLWLVDFAIVAANGTAKVYYLGPATSLLFAPGAVGCERWLTAGGWRRLRPVLVGAILALGLIATPLALPLLSESRYLAYAAALRIQPRAAERQPLGELPQLFADQHGWQEMADKVAKAYRSLSPEEQRKVAIYGQNYGESGALDVLGRKLGLPPAIGRHNSYWFWGPGEATGEVMIVLGGGAEDNARHFETIEIVDHVRCEWCMPYERDLPVSIGRRLKGSLAELWPQIRLLI